MWGAPFDHNIPPNTPYYGNRFNAIHNVLIGKPPYSGWLIVMDEADPVQAPYNAVQRYSLINPATNPVTFICTHLVLPGPNKRTTANENIPGDFFCCGHVATRDGDILFAGGTIYNPTGVTPPLEGGRLVYRWDPNSFNGASAGWSPLPLLLDGRYYPTMIVAAQDGRGLDLYRVSGGVYQAYPPALPGDNHYEMYRRLNATTITYDTDSSNVRQHYAGPDQSSSCNNFASGTFYWYPREFLLSTGHIFMSGMARNGARVLHDRDVVSPTWNYAIGQAGTCGYYSHDGSAVLLPMDLNVSGSPKDRILRMGGTYTFGPDEINGVPVPTDEVALCQANPSGGSSPWAVQTPLLRQRRYSNAVLLPDDSILVVGGVRSGSILNLDSELILPNGKHIATPPMAPRDYHSTAVLLPDGRVLVSGGEHRTYDYQIYSPPYLFAGPRPQILSAPTTISYGSSYLTGYSMADAAYVARVVLMRPGSCTHHFNFEQRSIALSQVTGTPPPEGYIAFSTGSPLDTNYAPAGWWMLFLVTNTGVPSNAVWVQLV